MRALDIKPGEIYGNLKVISLDLTSKSRKWILLCRCGKQISCKSNAFVSGVQVSCGCHKTNLFIARNTKHGDHESLEYKAWENMKIRCTCKKSPYYKHYGARGIRFCERWKDYENFLIDMGRKPSPEYELDRYPNNNGNYEPSNCRWATRKQQLNNVRHNFRITVNGETKTATEWSEVSGVHPATIKCRIKSGRSPEESVYTKPHKMRKINE